MKSVPQTKQQSAHAHAAYRVLGSDEHSSHTHTKLQCCSTLDSTKLSAGVHRITATEQGIGRRFYSSAPNSTHTHRWQMKVDMQVLVAVVMLVVVMLPVVMVVVMVVVA